MPVSEPFSETFRVVIVGGGTAGWMTASALSQALPRSKYRITLIESDTVSSVGVGESTIPSMVGFNQFIGLDERTFLRETKATFKLGIEFVHWRNEGHSYIHPFGEYGIDMHSVPFHHYWLRAREQGSAEQLEKFSLETRAIKAERFVKNTGISHPRLGKTAYAYHLDATRYAQTLAELAKSRGVEHISGHVEHVQVSEIDGTIESVRLASQEAIAGELFIDCSGARGLLIEGALHTGYEEWSQFLPCDSAWAVQCEGDPPPLPFTRATAHNAGWGWRIPLQHRVGNGRVYSSQFLGDEEAREGLISSLEGEALSEPRLLRFNAGVRKKAWNKNCVAIGLSSGFLEPLESTSIHLIQVGIFRLLGLFPRRREEATFAAIYNTEMRRLSERIRDFLVLHYHATARTDSPFWSYCKNMSVPDSLREKIALYRESGLILPDSEDLFKESSWLAVMEGQGIRAQNYHPLADALSADELKSLLAQVQGVLDQSVRDMPSHNEFLQLYCAS